jgi:dissimilatory sulfite reductase (desulfoviridin) alpha/beta subunit
MIPKELVTHAAILRTLARSKPRVLTKQIKQLSPRVVRAIQNISKNYLKGSVSLTKRQKQRLHQHRRLLKELALRKTSIKRSKNILQKGGFLGTLLAPLIGIFSKLLLK